MKLKFVDVPRLPDELPALKASEVLVPVRGTAPLGVVVVPRSGEVVDGVQSVALHYVLTSMNRLSASGDMVKGDVFEVRGVADSRWLFYTHDWKSTARWNLYGDAGDVLPRIVQSSPGNVVPVQELYSLYSEYSGHPVTMRRFGFAMTKMRMYRDSRYLDGGVKRCVLDIATRTPTDGELALLVAKRAVALWTALAKAGRNPGKHESAVDAFYRFDKTLSGRGRTRLRKESKELAIAKIRVVAAQMA